MRIYQWACICPMCRVEFTAFTGDEVPPERDEVAYDKKSLLCNLCEHRFVNVLFQEIAGIMRTNDGMAYLEMRLPKMPATAPVAGEPASASPVVADQPTAFFARMRSLSSGQVAGGSEGGVSSRVDPPGEALRGPSHLPPEQP